MEKRQGLFEDLLKLINETDIIYHLEERRDQGYFGADKVSKLQKFLELVHTLNNPPLAEKYDPNYGDDKICRCGHPYYRHFDTYDDMYPVGCKYCCCPSYVELPEGETPIDYNDPSYWEQVSQIENLD